MLDLLHHIGREVCNAAIANSCKTAFKKVPQNRPDYNELDLGYFNTIVVLESLEGITATKLLSNYATQVRVMREYFNFNGETFPILPRYHFFFLVLLRCHFQGILDFGGRKIYTGQKV